MCLSLACLMCALLSGCSLSSTAGPTPDAGPAIHGVVHGGQNPIVGAQVYLFAANTTLYGGSSKSLLTNVPGQTNLNAVGGPLVGDYFASTGTGGAFSISSDYTCTGGQQVYLYVLSGNSGSGTNTAAGLLAALGTCPGGTGSTGNTFSSGLYVVVNEVSTVATAYAVAGFATDAVHVSSSGTALATTGIANAFANVANMEALGTGVALATTPAGNGSVPHAEIYTLANILASCVNSTGPGSTACTTLFADAKSGGSSGTAPTDTATAAINMAHNPGANITALYGLSTGTPPFAGALGTQPNDFTVALSFSGGGLKGPESLAIDGGGNVWAANSDAFSISELSSLGAAVSPASTGYPNGETCSPCSAGNAIAIDGSGNAWEANLGDNSVTELTSGGVAFSGSPYKVGSLNGPSGIAVDGNGNAWTGNVNSNSVTKLTAGGASGTNFAPAAANLNTPYGIAVDPSESIWAANDGSGSVSKLTGGGSTGANFAPSGSGLTAGYAIAIDSGNNAWVTNFGNSSSVVELTSSGGRATGEPFSVSGLLFPQGIAVDGLGNVWVVDENNAIFELSNAGAQQSPSPGYLSSGLNSPLDIAVDGSGNVWVANQGAFPTGTLTEFVGAAAPVVTPLAVGVKNSTLGTRP
jgi:streptogramin lyase